MQLISKVYEVYNFEELSEEVQNKLIEQEKENIYNNYMDLCLYDDMTFKAEELLQKYFGDKATLNHVYYSLSYCQGDGAMIEFELYYYNKLVKIHQSGFYYHSRSFTIDTYELTEKQEEQLYNKIVKMNEELESYGWQLVGWEPEEAEAKENLKENKYLQDGTIFN